MYYPEVPTVTVDIPPTFYDDHIERDLNSGFEVKRTKKYVRVVLDFDDFYELLSDARYYADRYGPDTPWLKPSARATVRKLEAVKHRI